MSEEDSDDDDDTSYKEWLKKVATCLEGQKKGDPEKMDHVVTESLTESERCMKVVRSVIDEETVLDMINTFLQMTKVILNEAAYTTFFIIINHQ